MITSPHSISRWMAPQVPTRMNVSAPMAMSSSSALAVEGPPAPVEQAEMGPPSAQRAR